MKDSEKINLNSLIKNDKIKKIIIAAGFIGIALIFLSTFVNFQFTENKEEETANLFSVEKYREETQESIKEMIESIEGVGRANVLLTIENSVECVYLENNTTKAKEIEPVVRGVVVSCQGGDNPVVVQRVLSAVTKALNISTAKVCVTKSTNTIKN